MSQAKQKSQGKYAWFWKKLDQYLSGAQLKQSKQRNMIIEYFIELDSHVSAEELHDYIRDKGHNTGLATIYRTLNLLKEAHLAEQRVFSDGKAIYEILNPDSHHDHLVCMKCDKVVEFENDEIERLQEEVASELGFSLLSHNHVLFGHCKSCQ